MRRWDRLVTAFAELARGRQLLLITLALLALSFAQYAYTLGNPLIWDSQFIIVKDPTIRELTNIPSFFLEPSLSPEKLGYDNVIPLNLYRPVLKVLYALEYALFETRPLPYHLVNIVVNAGVVLALLFLVRALSGDLKLATSATLLYAVNPAKSVSVFWVYGISNLVMGLFVILALYAYHERKHAWAMAAFALALFSRESAVLFPVILLIYEYFLRPEGRARRYLAVAPYFALTLLYLVARTMAVGSLPAVTEISPLALINSAAVITKRLLKILVFPDAPVAFYPYQSFDAVDGEVVISFAVVALAIALLMLLWRRNKSLAFWYLWGFVWLALMFNVGRLGDFLMSEKQMYLPAAGFCVVVAAFVLRLRFAPLLLALIVSTHFTVTFARSTHWREPIAFFEQAAAFAPELVRLRHHLGLLHAEVGNYRAAADHLELLVEKRPNDSLALNNLGNSYYMLGERHRAATMWARALAADPGNAEPAYNLGMMAENAGNLAEALAYYRKYVAAAREVPPDIMSHIQRLERLATTGDSAR